MSNTTNQSATQSATRIASPQELAERANLRSYLFMFFGQYRNSLDARGKILCTDRDKIATTYDKLWHRGSAYVCDVITLLEEKEEYRCNDCGIVWYLPIPKRPDGAPIPTNHTEH